MHQLQWRTRSCPVWKKEKEVVTLKYTSGLSFPEARKIVETRHKMGVSYASVSKASTEHVQRKEAQTQTAEAAVQTDNSESLKSQEKSTSLTNNTQEPTASSKPSTKKQSGTQVQAKAPSSPGQRRNKSPTKVLSDRLPKGSDDQIRQFNCFGFLDDDMEAEDSQAESNINRQGRIIKLNNKKLKDTHFQCSVVFLLFSIFS